MSSEYRRKGPHLSLIERTDAVLRSLDGESHERLAEEFHVRPGQIAIWLGQWEERRSPWRSDLSPAELLAGCVVRDVEKTERNAAGIDHTRRTKSVERGPRRTDPDLVAAMQAERRELFIELITKLPTEFSSSLDQHTRVWQMLDSATRDELGPAWDAYQEAADMLRTTTARIAAIIAQVATITRQANAETVGSA